MENNRKIHPIGYVSRQTGLSAHVIRAWERRYGSVKPDRTATGRRLYSESDIRHLQLLHLATRSGHRISQLSALKEESLQEIVDRNAADARWTGDREEALSTAGDFFKACNAAVRHLDDSALEAALNRAAVVLTRPMLVEGVIIPLMKDIGARWAEGSLKIINEHMASSILRSFLWDMLYAHPPQPKAPKIVVATPAEHWHEFGALIAGIAAIEEGWAVCYFGPNLPAEEIAAAAEINGAAAVALSIVYMIGEAQMLREIKRLRHYLSEDIPLIIGGSGIAPYQANLKQIGALFIEDLPDFRDTLNQLV